MDPIFITHVYLIVPVVEAPFPASAKGISACSTSCTLHSLSTRAHARVRRHFPFANLPLATRALFVPPTCRGLPPSHSVFRHEATRIEFIPAIWTECDKLFLGKQCSGTIRWETLHIFVLTKSSSNV